MSRVSDVLVWGTNGYNRLGLGDSRDQPLPALLGGVDGREIRSVSAGLYHSAIVTDDGRVYLFGSNATCCLGDFGDLKRPHWFEGLSRVKIVQVAVGGDLMGAHTLAVSNAGRLYAWGSGKACGVGSCEVVAVPTLVTDFLRQSDSIETSAPERIVFASAGGSCSAVITAEGVVFTFGISVSGRLGYRGPGKVQWRPRRVDALLGENVRAISAGKNGHMLATTSRGELFVWGENSRGQLGLGDLNDRSAPVRVAHPTHGVWSASIAAGESHSLAVDLDGKLWTWGLGTNRLCSDLTLAMCVSFQLEGLPFVWARPSLVSPLQDFRVTRIAAGAAHSVAVTSEGFTFVWGAKHQRGVIGVGDLLRLSSVWSPAAVAAGHYHTLVATSSPNVVVNHLLKCLVSPICPASCDASVTCISGEKMFFPSALLKSRIGDAAWESFWRPQYHREGAHLLSKEEESLKDLAIAFNIKDEEEDQKKGEDNLVAAMLDELVANHSADSLEIPKECLFENLEKSAVVLFFEILYCHSLPSECDEVLLRSVLPVAIVSQLAGPVALIQQRLKHIQATQAVPQNNFEKIGSKNVIFKCGKPLYHEMGQYVSAHAFVVEAFFPLINLPAGDALCDTSPARFAKGLVGVNTGANTFSVSCPEVPADVMRELIGFGYNSRFTLSDPETDFFESEEETIRFWLTVCGVAKTLGSDWARAAAVDKVLEQLSPTNWLQVHLTRLRMRLPRYHLLDESVLAVAIEAKVKEVGVTQFEAFATKAELVQTIDNLLGGSREVEDEELAHRIRTGVINRVSADMDIAKKLAQKLEHFNGLNLDPLNNQGDGHLTKWQALRGSLSRGVRAMNLSLRGGPSLSATVRDLSLLGVAVAGLSIYAASGHSLVAFSSKNLVPVMYVLFFFVSLTLITNFLLKSKA